MFVSLRRWTGQSVPENEPWIDVTGAVMDETGVARALICALSEATVALISNEEVAGFVAAAPERSVGAAPVDLRGPVAAVRESCEWFT